MSAAAKRGPSRAKANLARMYADGLGVKKDLPEALRLYEAAANSGEFFAQIALARIFSSGRDIAADPGAARRWYSAVAAQEGAVDECDELREGKDYLNRTRS